MEEEDDFISDETRSLSGVFGLDKECFSEIDYLNKSDGAFGTIAIGLSPSLCYLIRSIEDPKEFIETRRNSGQIWTEPLE